MYKYEVQKEVKYCLGNHGYQVLILYGTMVNLVHTIENGKHPLCLEVCYHLLYELMFDPNQQAAQASCLLVNVHHLLCPIFGLPTSKPLLVLFDF